MADDSVPTRFPSLDRVIGGGFRRGDLILLCGDDGAGASAFALAVATRVTPRSLLVTGEARAERVLERATAMTAGVTLDSLRLGTLTVDEEARVADAGARLRARMPMVETLYRGGVAAVHGALDGEPTAPLVIVDGLDALLPDEGDDAGAHAALTSRVLALKRLALERDVAVLLLTHLPSLDRTRPDRRPRLADLPARGAIAVHADLVLGLYREEMYDGAMGVAGAAELMLLKYRDGALGYVDLYFTASCLRFQDVLDPDV